MVLAWRQRYQALVLLALLIAQADRLLAAERRLHIRDLPEPAQKCRNTVQGRLLVADDRGYLCKRDQLDYKSGCCSGGLEYDCNMCTMHDKCCTEFEACVSCCLKPEHDATVMAKRFLRSSRLKYSGYWGDPFEYCKGVCRTHSRSTVHENAYVSNRHHCFSAPHGRPKLSAPLPIGALDGVDVFLGGPNESCDTVGTKRGKACSARHFAFLNNCDALREHSDCEAGCEATTTEHAAVPAYVGTNAPKANRPAMCFHHQSASAITCGTAEKHYHRLCPCTSSR